MEKNAVSTMFEHEFHSMTQKVEKKYKCCTHQNLCTRCPSGSPMWLILLNVGSHGFPQAWPPRAVAATTKGSSEFKVYSLKPQDHGLPTLTEATKQGFALLHRYQSSQNQFSLPSKTPIWATYAHILSMDIT